jgi:hypothetical protein
MTAQLAVTALRTAVPRRQPTGVVVVHCPATADRNFEQDHSKPS